MSAYYFYPLPDMHAWHASTAQQEENAPYANRCMLLGIQQVAHLTLWWMNALRMHNGLPTSAITEVVLMQNYSFPSAVEKYGEAAACRESSVGDRVAWLSCFSPYIMSLASHFTVYKHQISPPLCLRWISHQEESLLTHCEVLYQLVSQA